MIKKLFCNVYNVALALCMGTMMLATSCNDEFAAEHTSTHHPGEMVEVKIPFSVSQGITADIETRAGEDSKLNGIVVLVYENEHADPSQNKRVGYYMFENPEMGGLEGSDGGWTPDPNDPTGQSGTIKFHVPMGKCYIYMLGNSLGSFLDIFPELPEGEKLETLADLWKYGTPKWTGNLHTVDGFLPLVGKVNNDDGACIVESNGTITYIGRDGVEHNIEPGAEDENFVLKRLMTKVTVNIKSGSNGTFTPKDYRFRHVSSYVPPVQSAYKSFASTYLDKVQDTNVYPFGTQSGNSFTVYLPENVPSAKEDALPIVPTDANFAWREELMKDSNGQIITEETDGHTDGHYKFKNAPETATYMEITGSYQATDGTIADTRYYIHLGDFRNGNYGNFDLIRDHHYTYNVTVNGVNSIMVEVDGGDDAPGAEGIVFTGGIRANLDSHYEQVEMKFTKGDLSEGSIIIYADTPYGDISYSYVKGQESEELNKQTEWIKFKKQSAKGTLARYGSDVLTVQQALDEFFNGTDTEAYYTCFVDEYYYTKNPVTGANATLSEFVNADERTFCISSGMKYSADGKSAVAEAKYVLQQRAIATFYDLGNETTNKYGVEITDEIGKRIQYGTPAARNTIEFKDGRANTIAEIGSNNFSVVNWDKNGWLLNASGTALEQSAVRLTSEYGFLSCLTRNRDFNGNGAIDADELRWYTPALHQVMGLWIGESAMPAEAALFTGLTSSLPNDGSGTCLYPIYTSNADINNDEGFRIVWAEQGCSFGPNVGSNDYTGTVRAVRNLGASVATDDSYATAAGAYYTYDADKRTITTLLAPIALRQYSSRELAPHHERSLINRPPKTFQVAAHPYVIQRTETCSGGIGHTTHNKTYTYWQLQRIYSNDAKTQTTTIARNYPGDGEAQESVADWRLPNQRELAMMIVAMGGKDLGYVRDDYTQYGVSHGFGQNWSPQRNYLLQCRTNFSNENYDKDEASGYMLNTNSNLIQLYYATGALGIWTDNDRQAGCLCVRDVE